MSNPVSPAHRAEPVEDPAHSVEPARDTVNEPQPLASPPTHTSSEVSDVSATSIDAVDDADADRAVSIVDDNTFSTIRPTASHRSVSNSSSTSLSTAASGVSAISATMSSLKSPPIGAMSPPLSGASPLLGSGAFARSDMPIPRPASALSRERDPSQRHSRRYSRILPISDDPASPPARKPSVRRSMMLPIGPRSSSPEAVDHSSAAVSQASQSGKSTATASLASESIPSLNVPSGSPPSVKFETEREEEEKSTFSSLSPFRRKSSDTSISTSKRLSLGWFSGRPASPSKGGSTDSLNAMVQRDFIMRRINANNAARSAQGMKSAEESQSGLLELQQNFAEISRDSAKYNDVDWEFWTQVVQDYANVARTQPQKLKSAIQQGFPPGLRSLLWQVISSSKNPALEQVYSSVVGEESPHEKAIHKDLDRTSMVRQVDTDSLYRILKAYSLFDPEVGYTQGMAFIVVPLLLDLSEYEVFCLYVQLMKTYDLRSLFLPEMPGLHLKLYQFDRLIEDRLELVHIHLKRQGALSSMYASQWFLTMFAYKFPITLVQRIFDIVIAEGSEAVLRFAFILMQTSASKILELEFDALLPFLKDNIFDTYIDRPNDLVRDASTIELTPSMLAKYELEYNELNRQEKERVEQVETLRTSNTKLTFQVRQLEASLADLNSEHVEIANKMVETGLENARLTHENEHLQAELKKYRDATENKKEVVELVADKNELLEVRKRLEAQIEGLQEALAAAMSEA